MYTFAELDKFIHVAVAKVQRYLKSLDGIDNVCLTTEMKKNINCYDNAW